MARIELVGAEEAGQERFKGEAARVRLHGGQIGQATVEVCHIGGRARVQDHAVQHRNRDARQ
jgi:hypothetical protein